MRTVRIIISGTVQGVGFRAFVHQMAHKNGVTGWVRNVRQDMVEAVLQGENNAIEAVISACYMGPTASEVENVHVENEETKETFVDFKMKPTIENVPS